MLACALEAHASGLCVLPPKGNGTKVPLLPWTEFQERRSSVDEIHKWYGDGSLTGIGVVLGKPSGNLELFEFDDADAYGRFKTLTQAAGLSDVVERIEAGYLEESPNGIHWLYRCQDISGNTKLARRPKRAEEQSHAKDNTKVLIETRGTGGFAILAPSHGPVHPSGQPYKLLRGGFASIVTITPAQREQLFDLARTLDDMPRRDVRAQVALVDRGFQSGERPGDYFNRTKSWGEVLEPFGWQHCFEHGGLTYWRRPGKDHGTSATTNYHDSDLLKVFTSSSEFEPEGTYTKFAAYAVLAHRGDFGAAARAIYADMPKTPGERHLSPVPSGDGAELLTGEEGSAPSSNGGYPARYRSRLFDAHGVMNMKPPEWLIKGLIPMNTLAVVWGKPGSAKSFLVLDFALCVASGAWWKGHEVGDPAKVLYVAAEGAAGLGQRIRAWSKANNIHGLSKANWLADTVNLLAPEQFEAFAEIVREVQPKLIVIDTLARSMPGADENAAQDMGRLVERADALRAISGATILLVHHSTKEGSTARGSGSLGGAVDTEIEVKKEGSTVGLYCRKQKDAGEFAPFSLQLVTEQSSCVLSQSHGPVRLVGDDDTISQAKKLWRETVGETGIRGSEWRDLCLERLGISRATYFRLRKELVETKFLNQTGTAYSPVFEPGENY